MREVLFIGAALVALAMGCAVKSNDEDGWGGSNSEPCDCPKGKITASYDDLFADNWRLVKRTYNDKEVDDFSKETICNSGRIAYRKEEKFLSREDVISAFASEGKSDAILIYQGAESPLFSEDNCTGLLKTSFPIRSFNKESSCIRIGLGDEICIIEFTPKKLIYQYGKDEIYEFARN